MPSCCRVTRNIFLHDSDEAPSTCNVFLTEGGLELFMKLLHLTGGEETDNHVQVETKILGLLVSVAGLLAGERGKTVTSLEAYFI